MAKLYKIFFAVLLCLMAAFPARAEEIIFSSPELAIAKQVLKTESGILIAMRLAIAPGWHTYANGEKRTGKPTVLSLISSIAEDKARIKIFYPVGELENDVFDPTLKVLSYEKNVVVFALLQNGLEAKSLAGSLNMLLCSAQSCLPLKADIKLDLPFAGNLPDIADKPELAALWHSALPEAATGSANVLEAKGEFVKPGGEQAAFAIDPDKLGRALEPLRLTPRFYDLRLEVGTLGKAIFLGLVAGFLLNVMPCVLPVLALKAGALLVTGAEMDARRKKALMRRYSLFFALGIITFFVVLAILAGAAGVMWGQSFQSPFIVHAMAALVFLLGASMFGAFTLPIIDLKSGSGSTISQAYFTGFFTTLLATPCSGPLLGGVLGWSFTQPGAARAIVFAAIGLGMALPHFAMAYRPGLALFLPRPGPWMGVVEKFVGFFLLGVGLYLVSILPIKMHITVLTGILFMVVSSWIWGRFGGIQASSRIKGAAVGLFCICLVAVAAWAPYRGHSNEVQWEEFNYAEFRAALGKQNMLLDFTADWCPNCKLLESTTLDDANVAAWQKKFSLRLIKVDLTVANTEGQDLLKALKSASIPLVAVFPAGSEAMSPVVLRDIFSAGQMEKSLSGAIK